MSYTVVLWIMAQFHYSRSNMLHKYGFYRKFSELSDKLDTSANGSIDILFICQGFNSLSILSNISNSLLRYQIMQLFGV